MLLQKTFIMCFTIFLILSEFFSSKNCDTHVRRKCGGAVNKLMKILRIKSKAKPIINNAEKEGQLPFSSENAVHVTSDSGLVNESYTVSHTTNSIESGSSSAIDENAVHVTSDSGLVDESYTVSHTTNSIESGSSPDIDGVDWRSYPARQYAYNRTILEGLQHSPTFENDKIHLTENDVDLLSATDGLYSVERTRAEEILSRKIEALQCFSGLVLQNDLELLRTKYHNDHIAQIDEDLTRLLAVFYTLKTTVRNCFWRIHIKLKTYTTYIQTELPEELFSDLGENIDNIGEYCQWCERAGLMVMSQTSQPDNLKRSPQLVDEINLVLEEPAKLFQLLNYNLSLWDHQITHTVDEVCKSSSRVLWTVAKSRMMKSRQCMLLQSLGSTWHLEPFEHVQFHTIVLRIVQANVMYRVLVHLKTYAAYLERHNSLDGPAELPNRLTPFWLLLREPLSLAVDILDLRDGVLWSLNYHMSITETIDVYNLNSMISHMQNFLGREYLQFEVPVGQWGLEDSDLEVGKTADLETDEVGETTDLETDDVTKNTRLLRLYVEKVRAIFIPINIAFVRFFLNGQNA